MAKDRRSPSGAGTLRDAPPWRRRAIKIAAALAILAALAWGLFTWLFFNPFEGSLERLDRILPPSSGAAALGSVEAMLATPFVKDRILARRDVEEALSGWGLEDALRRLAEEQEKLNARLPGFLGGFDIRRDFLGRETAAFGILRAGKEGPPVPRLAVATRLSFKARVALSVLKHGWARRRLEAQSPLKIKRYPLYYEIDASGATSDPAWKDCYAALAKDVLVVGNDRALVTDAARLAATGGVGSLPDRPDAGLAFSAGSTAPLRLWVDLSRLGQDRAAAGLPTLGDRLAASGGIQGFLAALLDPAATATVQAVAEFPSRDEALVEVSGIRGEGTMPVLAEAMAAGATRPAGEAVREAAALAPAGSAFAAVRLEVPAGALARTVFGRMDPDTRRGVDRLLVDAKTSLDDLAREFDDYLLPGASLVVERLPECDALSLDQFGANAQGEFVLPVPGVLLVMRQRTSAGEGAAERMLRRNLDKVKEQLPGYADLEGLPDGVRGFRFRPKFLTADMALVKPAAAFEGDLVFLATNEGTLRRALDARAGKVSALSDFEGFEAAAARCGEGQAAAFVEMGATLKYLKDQRREAATAMVERDWVAERKRIFSDVALRAFQGQQQVEQKQVEAEVEKRMEQAQEDARTVDFPRAIDRYLLSLRSLEEIRSVAGGLAWDSSGFRLLVALRTEE